jgi:5'-nucleotidase
MAQLRYAAPVMPPSRARTPWLGSFAILVLIPSASVTWAAAPPPALQPAGQTASPPAGGTTPPSGTGLTVLFTNDDGYEAPGLQALVSAFVGHGELFVAAPATNQTAKGHSLNLSDAVPVRRRTADGVEAAFAIDGTPATSALLGFSTYLPKRPDLVISGINRGENLGVSVYLSGTLGAARQAAFNGIPAIAVSMFGNAAEDYARAAAYVRGLVDDLRRRGLVRPGLFLNVNVPAGEPKGVVVTRLSVRPSQPAYECTPPVGERSACFPVRYQQVTSDEPGTDVGEFYKGFITITPMTLDVTDTPAMGALEALEREDGTKRQPR